MISFPSTLNKGGAAQPTANNSTSSVGAVLSKSFTSAFNNTVARMTTSKGYDTDGIDYDVPRDYKTVVAKDNFASKVSDENKTTGLTPTTSTLVLKSGANLLDEEKFGMGVLNAVDNYAAAFKEVDIDSGMEFPKDDKNEMYNKLIYTVAKVAPSMFNPMYGLNSHGISRNVPLKLGNKKDSESIQDAQSLDCSIANLVRLSNLNSDLLGLARYKFADFMYCRDVGKISNNHMITLRKFSIPVGDNIFGLASSRSGKWKSSSASYPSDIGRMITWFGTPENKLEDIMSYEYEATFIQKESKIQQLDSQEDDDSRGIAGKIINSANPLYNKAVAAGTADGGFYRDVAQAVLGKFGVNLKPAPYKSNDVALGRNYDNNKVYEPKDTIRDTHMYEGKLVFKHEFALTFNYKLKMYNDINPKAAMLDLLANVLTTTYRKGKFWGGAQQILGPQPNYDGWNKYNSFINKACNQAGSYLDEIFNFKGGELDGFLGWFSNMLSSMGGITGAAQKIFDGVTEAGKKVAEKVKDGSLVEDINSGATKLWNKMKQSGAGSFAMGMLKNQLGRPSLYAFDSLLTGANVGPWHVTIGNPLNPIAVFGNLIMTNCKVTHSGPLGLDDFPTDLTVTVSLKHGKSRDSVDISKMYTRGAQSIMLSLSSPKRNSQTKLSDKGKYVYDEYKNQYSWEGKTTPNPLFAFTGGNNDFDVNAKELR